MIDQTAMLADYIAAALWSSMDYKGDPLDDAYSPDDLADETREAMRRDCQRFAEQVEREGLTIETDHPGHDFWLTRNGHGAGFWDGDYPEHGDRLTEISETFGPCDLYEGDDNKLYL